jgi:hypothetical protein
VGLALGPDRIVLADEAPDVLYQVVGEIAGLAVGPDRVDAIQPWDAAVAAVGDGDDEGRQRAVGDGGVEDLQAPPDG